jgi:hypothetical protein
VTATATSVFKLAMRRYQIIDIDRVKHQHKTDAKKTKTQAEDVTEGVPGETV